MTIGKWKLYETAQALATAAEFARTLDRAMETIFRKADAETVAKLNADAVFDGTDLAAKLKALSDWAQDEYERRSDDVMS